MAAFGGGQAQFELVDTVPEQCHLRLEAELAFGAALNAWRARGPLDHDIEWNQTLRPVWPIDQPGRNLAVSVPRSKRRTRHSGLGFGLGQRNPRCFLELREQFQLALPPSEPGLPIGCHSDPSL